MFLLDKLSEKRALVVFGLAVLFFANLIFKVPFFEKRMHLDELIWQQKGLEFLDSVFAKNWANTRLSTRPAATVEWLAGLNSLLYREAHLSAYFTLTVFNRLVFIAAWIIFSLFIFCLLLEIFDFNVAFASSLLLALYPALNDFNQFVWTDALLMWTQLASVLSFILYRRGRGRIYIYLSGVFFGFALLTKIIAWLTPFLLGLAVWFEPSVRQAPEEGGKGELKEKIKDIIFVTALGAAVFYLLYPASWLNPFLIFDRAAELELLDQAVKPFSVLYYLYSLFYFDPALAILSSLLLYFLIKERKYRGNGSFYYLYVFLSYLAVLTVISYSKDSQVESIASRRYYLPAIPFLIVFFAHNAFDLAKRKEYKAFIYFPAIIILAYVFNIIFDLYFEVAKF